MGLELVKVRILTGFSNQDTPKRHSDDATPPNVETVLAALTLNPEMDQQNPDIYWSALTILDAHRVCAAKKSC